MHSQTSCRIHAKRLSRRAFLEQLEDRSMMAVLDFSPPGNQTGTINDAIFAEGVQGSGGTGNLHSFVRISSNDPVTEGYNTSFRPLEFDENSSPTFTRDLPLSEIPIVIIDGVVYREFLLDTNESSTNRLLSLNKVEIYQTDTAGLTDYPFAGTAILRYDMDEGTLGNDTAPPSPDGNWVLLDANTPEGSGTANMHLYVPNSLFGTQQFVILYSEFGVTAAQDDGFEEWSVRDAEALFSISGRKFADLDGDHTDDGGTDPGLAGWTIFVDANNNGTLDPGELSTVTAADGTYTLTSLYPSAYTICEVLQPGWLQTFPLALGGCHSVLITDADLTGIDFGNQLIAAGIDIVKLVNGQDANTPPGPSLAIGSTAVFTYIVTNTGNVPLSNVAVVDDNGTPANLADDFSPTFSGGDLNANGLLDLNETWTYTASRIVTAGLFTNIATVAADQGVSDTDPANHTGIEQTLVAIDIEKLVNGDDADTPTGPLLPVGSTATFTYRVTNTGNVTLTGVVVTDDQGLTLSRQSDDPGNNDNDLEPGEVWVFTASTVVTAGQYTNVGSVTAEGNETAVSDSDPANHFGVQGGIDIEKLVNGLDADTTPGPILDVGDIATFTYIVTNTGNVPLSSVAVVDDNGTPADPADDFSPAFVGGDLNADGLLDPTETWTYTALRTVTLGQFCNIGTVTAGTPLQTQVTDSDAACHFGFPGIITPDKGNRSLPYVHLVNPSTGEFITSFLAYAVSFRGGVRVATGDITGDGIPEIITAPGRGTKAVVKVFRFDGVLLEKFLAYPSTFTGGVDLAIGDVNNDGQNDIVTAMSYNGNQVKVFKNPNGALTTLPTGPHPAYNFGTTTTVAPHLLAFNPFGTFKGGAAVEVADLGTVVKSGTIRSLNTTLDGRPEIIVANEAGRRSTVYVYGFKPYLTAASTGGTAYRLRTYLPFSSTFRGGLSLDVALINQDLIPDIIVGAKSLGNSQVQILDGASTASLGGFVAFSSAVTSSYNAPVNVTASDEDGDGFAEFILASQGSDGAYGRIRKFDSLTAALVDEWLESTFDPVSVDHFFGAYFTETLKRAPTVQS